MKTIRGRPRRDPATIVKYDVTPYLIRGEDDDLIAIIEAAPPKKRWATMKLMMRSGVSAMPSNAVVEDDSILDELLDF